jgi:hypothetical protein
MAVTLITGAEASTNNTSNNVVDMAADIAALEPNATPLVQLLDKLRKRPAKNPRVDWQTQDPMPRLTTITASAASNATSFSVANDYFRSGDVLRFTSLGFGFLVTASAAGSISGVKIGQGTQVSAASGSEIYIVSNANAEGSSLREIKFPQLASNYNYCQIITTEFGVTGTEQATTHYGGDERARLQKFHGIEHSRKWEDTLFFGSRDLQNTNQRSAGGLKDYLTTNVTADTGGTTESDFQSFLKSAFRYGSEEKVAFGSPTAISVIEGWARTNLRVNDNIAEKYGVQMKQYVSGQGIVNLMMHRNWNDSTTLGGYLFLVDLEDLELAMLRDNRLQSNVQAPDYDGFKDRYIGEGTLVIKDERKHALLTGIS